MRIGIDVGGTHTDAVLMDGRRVVAKVKTATTAGVTEGILTALGSLLEQAPAAGSGVTAVMIGTTHFTNAVVERQRLQNVAAVRIGLPATKALPPMVDWPADLRTAIGDCKFLCGGGHEFNGQPLADLDTQALRAVARRLAEGGITAAAVAAVFSPVNAAMEEQAAAILQAEAPGLSVSLSHEIGRLGLLERENAAILNACLQDLARRTIAAFRAALQHAGISAPLYLTQNDGTLMAADAAERYPVRTFSSGPTNSMRGAAFLSGLQDAMVVDIGGTTTDVGALQQGFPRAAALAIRVGGVRTNFRMPDVLSIGLGGGSLVVGEQPAIGPRSVGYELQQRALAFGGDTLTATDLAVAAGYAALGDAARLAHLDRALVARAVDRLHAMVEEAIDRMKLVADPVPVVLVGGGSILIDRPLQGAGAIVRPEHFEVANAVGAAIAQISGEVDRIYSLDQTPRDAALEHAKQEAVAKAVAAGARPETVQIVDAEDVPLAYLPGNATRIRVKAVGDLAAGKGVA